MTTIQVMSRAELCSMYNNKQEEARRNRVEQIVAEIYNLAVDQALHYPTTVYTFLILDSSMLPSVKLERKFYATNLSDIMAGLQPFFPDSIIRRRSVLRKDKVEVDISPTSIDDGSGQRLDYLDIDWTPNMST